MTCLLELETKRLVLKILDDSFAEKVLDYFIRNKSFLHLWEPIRDKSFYTLDYHREQLALELQRIKEERLFKVWIFEKEDRNFAKVIGSIALNEIVKGCFFSCFLGYRMDHQYINKGYITEGIEKVREYAFNELNLHRIEANIIPNNLASMKVVEKLGFYEEGMAIKYLKINGRWENHIHMVSRNILME